MRKMFHVHICNTKSLSQYFIRPPNNSQWNWFSFNLKLSTMRLKAVQELCQFQVINLKTIDTPSAHLKGKREMVKDRILESHRVWVMNDETRCKLKTWNSWWDHKNFRILCGAFASSFENFPSEFALTNFHLLKKFFLILGNFVYHLLVFEIAGKPKTDNYNSKSLRNVNHLEINM